MLNQLTIELVDTQETESIEPSNKIKMNKRQYKKKEKEPDKEKEKENIPVYLKKLEDNLTSFAKYMEIQQQSLNELYKQFKFIDKNARKIIEKQKALYQKNKNPRKCGFAKDANISEDLCRFIGVEPGSKVPRTQVTKILMNYIEQHKLVNPSNKKQVVPDEALWRILGDEARQSPPENLTHFTLQKYMNKHFSKIDG